MCRKVSPPGRTREPTRPIRGGPEVRHIECAKSFLGWRFRIVCGAYCLRRLALGRRAVTPKRSRYVCEPRAAISKTTFRGVAFTTRTHRRAQDSSMGPAPTTWSSAPRGSASVSSSAVRTTCFKAESVEREENAGEKRRYPRLDSTKGEPERDTARSAVGRTPSGGVQSFGARRRRAPHTVSITSSSAASSIE